MQIKILFLIALLFSWGCSTIGVQTTPTFMHLDTGKATNFRTLTMTDVNAFAPTTSTKIVLQCEPDASETEMPRCRPANVGSTDSTPGVITGLGGSVINSAAIVGSGYLIGKGIGESADDVNVVGAAEYNLNGDNNDFYDMSNTLPTPPTPVP